MWYDFMFVVFGSRSVNITMEVISELLYTCVWLEDFAIFHPSIGESNYDIVLLKRVMQGRPYPCSRLSMSCGWTMALVMCSEYTVGWGEERK